MVPKWFNVPVYTETDEKLMYLHLEAGDAVTSTVYTAVQSQTAVSAHFTSKQILPVGFAWQYSWIYTVYLSSLKPSPLITSTRFAC